MVPKRSKMVPKVPKKTKMYQTRKSSKIDPTRKPVYTLFSEPKLPRNTALGTKYSSNNYLGQFLISSQTIFKIQRTSRSKTPIAPKVLNPDVLNSSTVPILLFEARLLNESHEPRDVRQHPILWIWDLRRRPNRASRAKISKSAENLSCAKNFPTPDLWT